MKRYTLLKALTGVKVSENGRVGTPILAYVLKDNDTGDTKVVSKFNAYLSIGAYGATNCEAKARRTDEIDKKTGNHVMSYYLKPNDGTKINEYLLSVVD